MTNIETIEKDILDAMRAGDTTKRETLRMLKSSLKNYEIEKGNPLSADDITAVIQKEVKRRKEAIESYTAAGKPEQAAQEELEATLLSTYLPEQMSEEDIRSLITAYLEANPTTVQEMGKAMGALSPQFKGKADMSTVSRIVREEIQNKTT